MKPSRKWIWVVVLIGVVLAGYVGYRAFDKVQQAIQRRDRANDLEEIGFAYTRYHDAHKTWPSKPEDLRPYIHLARALHRLQEGQFVVDWDAYRKEKLAGSPGMVLGYEKEAPTKGGFVCYRDVRLENLTAAEVQAALQGAK